MGISKDRGSAAVEDVLGFWFAGAARDPAEADRRLSSWFERDPELDREIDDRFGALCREAAAGGLDAWADDPRGALALTILLDQFPRNLHRGSPGAFAQDEKALAVASAAVRAAHHVRLAPMERVFLVIPFEHAEDLAAQREGVRLLEELVALAPPEWRRIASLCLHFQRRHLAIVERFGRFPHRNRVLGRASTREELRYLENGGETFGG